MALSNRELAGSWVIGLLVLVVGAFVLSLGEDKPKVIPRQVVQVECFQKTDNYDKFRVSTFFYFWSDGTITLEENEFRCPDSMYSSNG